MRGCSADGPCPPAAFLTLLLWGFLRPGQAWRHRYGRTYVCCSQGHDSLQYCEIRGNWPPARMLGVPKTLSSHFPIPHAPPSGTATGNLESIFSVPQSLRLSLGSPLLPPGLHIFSPAQAIKVGGTEGPTCLQDALGTGTCGTKVVLASAAHTCLVPGPGPVGGVKRGMGLESAPAILEA